MTRAQRRLEAYGELIEQIYREVVTRQSWNPIAQAIQRQVGVDHLNVLIMQPERLIIDGGVSSLTESERLGYLTDWSLEDDIARTVLSTPATSIRSVDVEELMGPRKMRGCPAYEGFYEPNGMFHQIVVDFPAGNGLYGGITAQNGLRAGKITPAQVRLMEQLARHLRLAMRIGEQVSSLNARAARAERVLSHWGIALLRCGLDGHVIEVSEGFDGLLRRFGQALRLQGTHLCPANTALRGRLRRLLGESCQSHDGAHHAAPVLTLTPPGELPALECMVLPWPSTSPGPHDGEERLVVLRESGQPPAIDTLVLRYRLGVTPTEADVLGRLMIGESVPAIAESRGSTVETVRSYLKSLRQRLGCHSQGELIAQSWRALGFIPSATLR